jgi:biotin carboxyl carrier protein
MRYIATIEGAEQEVEVEELSSDTYSITLGNQKFQADMRRVGPASASVIINNRSFDFDLVREGEEILIASRTGATRLTLVDAARHAMRSRKTQREVSGRVEIKAGMPGRVINVLVAAGDEVKTGQGVIIVEAMKMENELKSPKAGKVMEVKVAAGQTVEKGALLLVIE